VVDELTWTEIAERLSGAYNYWLHTTGETGTPNATPVWGVVVQGVLYHYTESGTRKARNLVRNPRVAVHLESASDVVIVHGELEHLGHPGGRPEVVRALARKYHRPEELPFLPSTNAAFDVLYALRPKRAMTWCLPDTEASTRRWSKATRPIR
jgi:nitroimidazol reductase NimA-like FMN-containing flavoprotein (pyridoxamine 5'-phosphate oxidase superfamily)